MIERNSKVRRALLHNHLYIDWIMGVSQKLKPWFTKDSEIHGVSLSYLPLHGDSSQTPRSNRFHIISPGQCVNSIHFPQPEQCVSNINAQLFHQVGDLNSWIIKHTIGIYTLNFGRQAVSSHCCFCWRKKCQKRVQQGLISPWRSTAPTLCPKRLSLGTRTETVT